MDDHTQHTAHDRSKHDPTERQDPSQHEMMDHSEHTIASHAAHQAHQGHDMSAMANVDHTAHAGHEQMFRVRFWWSLLLSIPVLLYSDMIQMWLGFSPPLFPFSEWIPFVFSVIIFAYGGVPFLQMAMPELQERKPGMMTLISLAISVAFVYSVAALFINLGEGFFWELVTLIDIMLLCHWLEMRSVRQASGALSELAKLMPDTAEHVLHDEMTETVPVSTLKPGDLILVRPGTSIPADGEVVEGHSNVNEAMITGESKPVHKMAGAKVIAGRINGDGSLRIRVTATGDETALAGIMRLVEQAQQSKSRTQVLADKPAGWLFHIDAQPDQCAELNFLVVDEHQQERQYKPPSLRNVSERGPFMHAGQFATLEDVLNHYNTAPAAPVGHSDLQPLNLTEKQIAQIIAFLKTLDGPVDADPKWLRAPR